MDTLRPYASGRMGEYRKIGNGFLKRRRREIGEDLSDTIRLRLFEVAKPITASLTCMEHYHSEKRSGRIINLNSKMPDSRGETEPKAEQAEKKAPKVPPNAQR